MADIQKNIIREIAENLSCGFDCYLDPKTQEVVTIPNLSNIADEEEFKEAYKDDLKLIKSRKSDFLKLEVLDSFESFKIMERFVVQLTDTNFQSELDHILEMKRPFQNFKHAVENSDFRQSWFDFKQDQLEQIVETQLKLKIANRKK